MEQESESIVVEVAEAVADSFDLFDQQVGAFGGGVGESGVVVVEDLGFPRTGGPPV